jgi:hypothetical protein
MPVNDARERAEAERGKASTVIDKCLAEAASGNPFFVTRRDYLLALASFVTEEAVEVMGTKRLRVHVRATLDALALMHAEFDADQERRAEDERRKIQMERSAKQRELAHLELAHEQRFARPGPKPNPWYDLRESGPG